jgi:uncharacterized protein YbjT (DUF2867 family)
MTTAHEHELILVTGGTGKTGRRIAHRLTAAGRPVRVASRNTNPPLDWDNRATWTAILDGVHTAYLAYAPDAGFPGAATTLGAFAQHAVTAGVQRLVLLTGRGEDGAVRSEDAVRAATDAAAAELVVLRAAFFAQNFSEDFLLEAVRVGIIAFPADQVTEPFLDLEDLAEVAATVLTQNGHAGRTYELTGPRLLSFPGAVAAISAAAGRTLSYVPVSGAQFGAALTAAGLPEQFVGQLVALLLDVLDGHNAHVAGGVRQVLGRDPLDFTAYARRAAATGAFEQAPAPAR